MNTQGAAIPLPMIDFSLCHPERSPRSRGTPASGRAPVPPPLYVRPATPVFDRRVEVQFRIQEVEKYADEQTYTSLNSRFFCDASIAACAAASRATGIRNGEHDT